MVFELYIDKAIIFFLNFTLLIYFLRFLKIWTIFKHFIKFVTVFLLFYDLVFLASRHVGSSLLTKDGTQTLCIGRQSHNYWTAWVVPILSF